MSFLKLDNVNLDLRNFKLNNVNMNLPQGKVSVILGPSGSGKSVLLQTIAGFYKLQKGSIWLNNHDITWLPPEKRQIGFMLQDYALFPHMTVHQNILFPFRFRKINERDKATEVNKIISMLKIEKLLRRYPNTLSGGEKQRVALARTLMRKPWLILFDEPMSSLDARIREELREDLSQLMKELSLTSIYVTHDQDEAFALSDILNIMSEGCLIQTGSKEEVFRHPLTPFAARFVGMENLLKGRVEVIEKAESNLKHFKIKIDSFGDLIVIGDYTVTVGDEVTVGIRPEDIFLMSDSYIDNNLRSILPAPNIFPLTIKTIIPGGIMYKLNLIGKVSLTAFLAKQQIYNNGLTEGDTVMIGVSPNSIHLINRP